MFLVAANLYGQKQGNIWMFGQGAAINFNSGTPVSFPGSEVYGEPSAPGDYGYSEGCTSISDVNGNLLFYSNGDKVWNSRNQVMPHGDSLFGFYSSTTAALAIPVPLSDSLYYLFTTDGLERYLHHGLCYSLINMCEDQGLGDVIENQKNIHLLDIADEKLCAVALPDGTGVWLIAHKHFTNSFYAYLITPTGINPPIISNVGSVHTGSMGFYQGYGTAIGQMKASSDGKRLGLVFSNVTPSVAEVFDFDAASGVVSNVIGLQASNNEYGLEFSPDNTKLYTTNMSGLYQFDLAAGSPAAINASMTQITSAGCIPGPLQLGPDGKIYVARCTYVVGIIYKPNSPGLSCTFVNNGVNLTPGGHSTSLPSFIAGFQYHNDRIHSCGAASAGPDHPPTTLWEYPDMFSSAITIGTDGEMNNASLLLFNMIGQEVMNQRNLSGRQVTLDASNLSAGVYILQLTEDSTTITRKILVVR